MHKTSVVAIMAALLLGWGLEASAATSMSKAHVRRSVRGAIEAYDPAAHTLTLKTGPTSRTFALAADVKAWDGAKSLPLEQLSQDIGRRAVVLYTFRGRQRTAYTIRLTTVAAKHKARPTS